MSNILFVWRHNNDYDFTLPVVHAAASSGIFDKVFVYVSSEELIWRTDFRQEILKEFQNIEFVDVWSFLGWRGSIFRAICEYSKMTRGPFRKIIPRIASRIIARSGWREKLGLFIQNADPTLVAVDWVDVERDSKTSGPWGISLVAEWAKQRGRPIVGLLHGLSLATFESRANYVWSKSVQRLYIESETHRADVIAGGVPPQKLVVAGAPRFDRSWIDRVNSLITRKLGGKIEKKTGTNIVFFATKLVYDYDFERVIDWLVHVCSIKDVNLVVQPHPRGQGKRQFHRLSRLKNCVIDMHTPAAILIRQSDIVSTLVSSVICEAIVLGLPVLYPRFLNTISTRFDEEGACIPLNSKEETEGAIDRCLKLGVPAESYANFLERHVWGGQPSPISFTLDNMISLSKERNTA